MIVILLVLNFEICTWIVQRLNFCCLRTGFLSGGGIECPAPHELRRVGRPAKWHWEGALAHVVAMAQTPVGLPTGHGAQAKIEAIIAEWFTAETGNSPSISQIRTRAALVRVMIERPKA